MAWKLIEIGGHSLVTTHRAVWFDLAVEDLDRAVAFYRAVLACGIQKAAVGDVEFAVATYTPGVVVHLPGAKLTQGS